MIDLNELTKEKLLDPDIYSEVLKQAQEYISFDNPKAKLLAERISQELSLGAGIQPSELERQYSILISKLRFSALPFYSEREIKSFFEREIFNALGAEEFDIQQKLKTKLLDILVTERDNFKRRLASALTRNEQRVCRVIMVNNTELLGTVNNWFREYFINVGTEELDKLKQSQYFATNKNFISLPKDDRNKIKQLFNLYDWLRLSSMTPEGFEETITFKDRSGNIVSLEQGELVKLFKTSFYKQTQATPVKPLPTSVPEKSMGPIKPLISSVPERPAIFVPDLYKVFEDYQKTRELFLKIEDQLMTKTKGNIFQIKQELSNATRLGDKNTLVACLKILARAGSLQTVLQDHLAWFAAIAESMRKKYTTSYGQPSVEQMISNAKLNPGNPALLSEFLQYLLKERLGMNENDSALVGLELGQMLYSDNQRFSDGNEATGQFEWVKHMIENGQLVSEL